MRRRFSISFCLPSRPPTEFTPSGFVLPQHQTQYDPLIADARSFLLRCIVKLRILTLSVCLAFLSQATFALEITPDGKVTFRTSAGEAQKVELQGQWAKDRIALEKSGDHWSVTVDSVPAGVWEYNFVIDGIGVIDSSNPQLKPNVSRAAASCMFRERLRIPGTGATFRMGPFISTPISRKSWDGVAMPWSTRRLGMRSRAIRNIRCWSSSMDRVISTIRGVHHGKAHWILDNLIADGKAVPMIVLMIDGHPWDRCRARPHCRNAKPR